MVGLVVLPATAYSVQARTGTGKSPVALICSLSVTGFLKENISVGCLMNDRCD